MRRISKLVAMVGVFGVLSLSQSFAADIAGTKCKKSGLTKTVSGKKYTCIKLGIARFQS
jgi:hypothetical protein